MAAITIAQILMAVFSHRQFLVDRSLNYTCRVSRWTFARSPEDPRCK
jgi:hypothetical protein